MKTFSYILINYLFILLAERSFRSFGGSGTA